MAASRSGAIVGITQVAPGAGLNEEQMEHLIGEYPGVFGRHCRHFLVVDEVTRVPALPDDDNLRSGRRS